MKVQIFNSVTELQAFLTSSGLTAAKVSAVYFDGASGKHVLVYTP